MNARTVSIAAIFIATAALLTGCVVAPPEPTQPPTPAPTRPPATQPAEVPPTTSPVPEPGVEIDPVVTHIVVRPEHLDLVNAAGAVVRELSYDTEGAAFADAMASVLGGPPDVEERPGGHEWWPSTRYTWPGVAVSDDHEREGIIADMNVNITFTHPVVGDGITVSTIQGFRPGDDLQSFAAEIGEEWNREAHVDFPAETGADLGPRGYDEWHDLYWEYANANAVSVNNWGGRGDPSITSVIFAPWNFGIGHV